MEWTPVHLSRVVHVQLKRLFATMSTGMFFRSFVWRRFVVCLRRLWPVVDKMVLIASIIDKTVVGLHTRKAITKECHTKVLN